MSNNVNLHIYKGMEGRFGFIDPVSKVVSSDNTYLVTSTRSISEMITSGETPLETIYKPIGLGVEEYNRDVANNVTIAVLLIEGGVNGINIPASYITKAPTDDVKRYAERILAINLGVVPLDENFESLCEELTDTVKDILGLQTTIGQMNFSNTVFVPKDEHEVFMLKINNAGNSHLSYKDKYHTLLEDYNNLLARLQKMESEINLNIENIVDAT